MGFQDVAFLLSRASFPTFLENCGRGERLVTTTCLKSVVGGKPLLCVGQISHSLYVIKFSRIWPPSVLGIISHFKQWCLSV